MTFIMFVNNCMFLIVAAQRMSGSVNKAIQFNSIHVAEEKPFCPKDSGRNRATDGEKFTVRHLANENGGEACERSRNQM